jgi:hypothetical protein
LCPGTYTVTATGAGGCSATATATISQPPALSAGASSVNPTCYGDCNGLISVSVTGGTPGYSYTGATTGLCAGSYTITVTDAQGCMTNASATLTNPPALIVSVPSSPDTICTGSCQMLQAIATGGALPYNYQWSSPSFLSATNIANPVCCPATTITYTVSVTDASGCMASALSTVIAPAPPVVTYSQSPFMVCDNISSITLSPGSPAGGSYSGTTVSGNTFSPSTAGSGTYPILYTYTDSSGCSGNASSNITVSVCSEIQESGIVEDILLYPNPTQGHVLVKGLEGDTEIRLFNCLGQEVLSRKTVGYEYELDLQDFQNGIYLVQIKSSNRIISRSLIKE